MSINIIRLLISLFTNNYFNWINIIYSSCRTCLYLACCYFLLYHATHLLDLVKIPLTCFNMVPKEMVLPMIHKYVYNFSCFTFLPSKKKNVIIILFTIRTFLFDIIQCLAIRNNMSYSIVLLRLLQWLNDISFWFSIYE